MAEFKIELDFDFEFANQVEADRFDTIDDGCWLVGWLLLLFLDGVPSKGTVTKHYKRWKINTTKPKSMSSNSTESLFRQTEFFVVAMQSSQESSNDVRFVNLSRQPNRLRSFSSFTFATGTSNTMSILLEK